MKQDRYNNGEDIKTKLLEYILSLSAKDRASFRERSSQIVDRIIAEWQKQKKLNDTDSD